MKYDKDTFSEMIRDWQADGNPEYDDLAVDDPQQNENGKWYAIASDSENTYELSDDDTGNIVINYIGHV